MTDKAYVQIDTDGAPVKAWIKGVPFEAAAAKQPCSFRLTIATGTRPVRAGRDARLTPA